MNYTNIVTRRTYPNGEISIALNGRNVPDVQHIAVQQVFDFDQPVQQVQMTLLAAQFNDLQADASEPPPAVSNGSVYVQVLPRATSTFKMRWQLAMRVLRGR